MDAPIQFLLDHWPGVLFRQDSDLQFTFVSPRIEDWTGLPIETWLKDPAVFLQCAHEADVERVRQHLQSAAAATAQLPFQFRFRHTATGRITHIHEVRGPARGSSGAPEGHEGFWQNVSELAQAGLRLESANWAEMLSRLTPGFAHDVNNVIAGVHGLSDTFLSQLPPEHPFHEGLTLVRRNTQQAAQFVQRLQQLHLPRTGDRAYHDLNAIAKDTAEILRRGIPRSIEIVTECAADQLPIHADAIGLQQAILALAFNAVDAMMDHGRLVLRTAAHPAMPTLSHVAGTIPAGPCVCVSVTDSGPGIPPGKLSGLFSSGFTTKPGHRGLGLGLPQARAFAECHGGAISVESNPAAGTTFHLWLPRSNFTEADTHQSAPRCRSVLLAGQTPRTLAEIADALRAQGIRAVVADGNAEELLSAADFEFNAVMLRLAMKDAETPRVVPFIRRHRLPLKLVIQPADCGEEDLDPKLIEKADLVLAESVGIERVAERIANELLGPKR